MRAVILLIWFISASFGDLDFNSKTRNFSVELFYHTLQGSDRDVVISPYIVWSLLISVAYETAGMTWEEVSKVFSLTEDRSEIVEEFRKLRTSVLVNDGADINLLNFVFYDEQFKVYSDSIRRLEDDFRFIAQRLYFQAPQQAADSALRTLRSYHVPLRSLIRTEDFVDSKMIMCNYLSFVAQWSKPFNVSDTSQDRYRDGNEQGKANVMYMKARLRSSNFESLHASVTELPYRGDGKYCMLLVRPHSGYDVRRVLGSLRGVSLKNVLDTLQQEAIELGLREVEVKLPRYATNSRVVLNTPLFNMGLSDVFDRNFANFNNFAEDKRYIGEITHRVTVVITESETIVHTTTPAYGLNTRIPAKQIPVKEPFIFLIIEKSSATVLFGGSYSKIYIY
ncbi:serine protease inhibitor 77Ba-like [Maniola hyperantus]|uniref:serine protease inhibitor 77Ba-like n=1 Tax=Aphantopus hyperantus TaxID=2795564 RepID=UPI001568A055|nr:serine protease inhibitor 77Ba-like [Maniola hyperantus]